MKYFLLIDNNIYFMLSLINVLAEAYFKSLHISVTSDYMNLYAETLLCPLKVTEKVELTWQKL